MARLLATAMEELGFRQKGKFVETSAQSILKMSNPSTDFQAMVSESGMSCLPMKIVVHASAEEVCGEVVKHLHA